MFESLLRALPSKGNNPEVDVLNSVRATGYPYDLRFTRKIDQQLLSEILIYTDAYHLLSVHEPCTKKKARQEAGLES
jgi:hypothetical protein